MKFLILSPYEPIKTHVWLFRLVHEYFFSVCDFLGGLIISPTFYFVIMFVIKLILIIELSILLIWWDYFDNCQCINWFAT